MNGHVKVASQEIAKTVLAVAVSLGSVIGYMHYQGGNEMLRGMDAAQLESIARPDPWRGADGRKNQVDIAQLQVALAGMRVELGSLELRIAVREGKPIPPEDFKARVDKLGGKLDALTEQVTQLRVVVAKMVGEMKKDDHTHK